jgi:hypothetical protein
MVASATSSGVRWTRRQWAWGLTLFSLWLGSFAALEGYRLRRKHRESETHHWVGAPAVIKDSWWGGGFPSNYDEIPRYNATVCYSYQAGNARYEGSYEWRGFTRKSEADEVVNRYPSGKALEVYYDPEDPALSVLERGMYPQAKAFWLESMLVSLLVAILVLLPLVVALRKYPQP